MAGSLTANTKSEDRKLSASAPRPTREDRVKALQDEQARTVKLVRYVQSLSDKHAALPKL